jgi:hypothetical protein
MLRLPDSLLAWGSSSFEQTLKQEIENLAAGTLPLHHGVSQGGKVDDSKITAIVLRVADESSTLDAHVGIFFSEIIGGCSCGDDPQTQNAYCEMHVCIEKPTARAVFTVIPE